jgi:glycosyltransferase involved in cell wall biosynthesis
MRCVSAANAAVGATTALAVTASRLWDEGKNVATLDSAAAYLRVPFQAAGPLQGPNGARASFARLECVGELDEAQLGAFLAPRPVFASAALYEPFGLSVLEAAQAGCALVLSDIATFRELWSDAAVFVDARDAQGFAGAIQRLIDDPQERARLGAASQQRARKYTPEATAARMHELYAQLTASAPLELAGAA